MILVVGLLRLGLDGSLFSLHPALGDVCGDGAAPAHCPVLAHPVYHGVRLLRAPIKAKARRRVPSARRTPNGNSFCRAVSTKIQTRFTPYADKMLT